MKITDNRMIQDIQAEFQRLFPFLRLEFYEGTYEPGRPTPPEKQLDPGKTIGEVRSTHTEGDLELSGGLTVSGLESSFWKKYGLCVQVFRRSGNLWLQTTKTDDWTLDKQNRKGGHSEQSWQEMHGRE